MREGPRSIGELGQKDAPNKRSRGGGTMKHTSTKTRTQNRHRQVGEHREQDPYRGDRRNTSREGNAQAGTACECQTAATVHDGGGTDESGGGGSIRDRRSSMDAPRRLPTAAPPVTAARPDGGDNSVVGHRDGRPRRPRPGGQQQLKVGAWQPRPQTIRRGSRYTLPTARWKGRRARSSGPWGGDPTGALGGVRAPVHLRGRTGAGWCGTARRARPQMAGRRGERWVDAPRGKRARRRRLDGGNRSPAAARVGRRASAGARRGCGASVSPGAVRLGARPGPPLEGGV